MAFALKAIVGFGISSADATAGRANTTKPSTARQVDALRIRFLSSVDGQVRLDPGSSGANAGPAISRSSATHRGTVATLRVATISVRADPCKIEHISGRQVAPRRGFRARHGENRPPRSSYPAIAERNRLRRKTGASLLNYQPQ